MGEVWRATDLVLDRPVAVKLLRYRYGAGRLELARFRAEARHAGSLSHAGIAQVYDYHEADSPIAPYLVMELVNGSSLAKLLEKGPVGPARTLNLLAQAARALQAAHTAGLVHRDIKPGNLLVSRDGQVKITDFGIAHAAGSEPLTSPGTLMGTPAYVAPEQVTGAPATPATDLYALGIVAFQCLTGRPPFTGPPVAVALAHQEKPLPPLPRSVPREVAALVADLTSKDPWMRPAGAGVVAQRAEELQTALTAAAARRQRKHRGRHIRQSAYAASATLAGAAIAATGVILAGMHGSVPAHTQSVLPTVSHAPAARSSHPAQRVAHPSRTPVTIATAAPDRGQQSAVGSSQPRTANVVATEAPPSTRPRARGTTTPKPTPTPTRSSTGGTPTPTGTPTTGTPTPTGTPPSGTPTPTGTPPTGTPTPSGTPTSNPPSPTASPTTNPPSSTAGPTSDPPTPSGGPTSDPPTPTANPTTGATSQSGSPANETPASGGQRALRLQGREEHEPQGRRGRPPVPCPRPLPLACLARLPFAVLGAG
jgi:serine/threonine protein kinase